MSETLDLLVDSTTRLLDSHLDEAASRRGRAGEWLGDAWAAVEEMGLPLAMLPEAAGGFGLTVQEALAIVRLTGRHAAPLPIAETMIANRALASAGLPLAQGPAAILPAIDQVTLHQDRLVGSVDRVAWGRNVGTLVLEVRDQTGGPVLVRLESEGWSVAAQGSNIAGMPRDTLAIDAKVDAGSIAPAPRPGLLVEGAAIRAIQLAGALERVLELTVQHVSERVQFGRTLSKFQAIQQELAKVAGEAAAAGAAADIAADALANDPGKAEFAVAAARVRTGDAAGIATNIAHQLHGAIGFTVEHRLHLFTTALWSWRDEFGGDPHWSRIVGKAALAVGPGGYWSFVAAA